VRKTMPIRQGARLGEKIKWIRTVKIGSDRKIIYLRI
jgi:hypothetical protein